MTTEGWTVPPPNSRSCDRCGHVGTDVSMALVRAVDGAYEAVERCKDHLACDDRRKAAS